MANITYDRDLIGTAHGFGLPFDRILRRMHVRVRYHRMSRVARTHAALLRAENHDAHLLHDVGLDAGRRPRLDWIGTIALALGGRL
jgi:hypothetical protein